MKSRGYKPDLLGYLFIILMSLNVMSCGDDSGSSPSPPSLSGDTTSHGFTWTIDTLGFVGWVDDVSALSENHVLIIGWFEDDLRQPGLRERATLYDLNNGVFTRRKIGDVPHLFSGFASREDFSSFGGEYSVLCQSNSVTKYDLQAGQPYKGNVQKMWGRKNGFESTAPAETP